MTQHDGFIDFLLKLESEQDRAALAELRRGVGQTLDEMPELGRYIFHFFKEPNRHKEDAFFLIATLFAMHSKNITTGNMGNHLRDMAEGNAEELERLEKRFAQLLTANRADLPELLPRIVNLLKAKDKERPINWSQLLDDVIYWGAGRQREWARGFWTKGKPESDSGMENETISIQE
jgi:CRISPR type I-E-associated protein CasB/Cse2